MKPQPPDRIISALRGGPQVIKMNVENENKPILSVNNIEVIYDQVILALRGVSLEVPKGKIVAFLSGGTSAQYTMLFLFAHFLLFFLSKTPNRKFIDCHR